MPRQRGERWGGGGGMGTGAAELEKGGTVAKAARRAMGGGGGGMGGGRRTLEASGDVLGPGPSSPWSWALWR